MKATIQECDCKHDYQDKTYGKKMRVHNPTKIKKGAAAPDKEKLMAFATTIRDTQIPLVKSESAAVVRNDIAAKLESFAKWIESQASTL